MINKEKMVSLSLLTVLITAFVFANLNGTSALLASENPSSTMTSNCDVTMRFETGNTTWIGGGVYLQCFNETKGENITECKPGNEFLAERRAGWAFGEPEIGAWYYIYSPELYGLYIGFCVEDVWGGGKTWYFRINATYDYWTGGPVNFTDFVPVTTFEVEKMLPTVETGVDYMAFVNHKKWNAVPDVGSWWNVATYPGKVVNVKFHISYLDFYWNDPDTGDDYWFVRFDELRNATGDVVTEIETTTPESPCPIEGMEGIQLIRTIEQTEYYVSSPACLLPKDSWWNITYPDEFSATQFHVDFSTRKIFIAFFRTYMHIDNIVGPNATTPPGFEHIEAIYADAPNVATIGSWYKVIEGPTPDPWTCWNITAPTKLAGVTFCIDIASEGVFHIDEVLNATGQPGPVTVEPPVANVTVEQFTPKIYVEASPYAEGYPDWYWNFTVSIKTDYIFHVWSYEFTLAWNSSLLECTEVNNGDLISGGTATFQAGNIDNINGKLDLTGAYFSYTKPDPAPQTHGTLATRTLATVEFTANLTGVDLGIHDITFGLETKLVGVTQDGYGEKYNAIDDFIGQIVDGQVKVKIPGDIDGSAKVDSDDFLKFGLAFGSIPTSDNWNAQADINRSGKVDSDDFLIFGLNFGQTTTKY